MRGKNEDMVTVSSWEDLKKINGTTKTVQIFVDYIGGDLRQILKEIASYVDVSGLILTGRDLKDKDLKVVPAHIKSLTINGSVSMTGEGLKNLPKNLEKLDLTNVHGITAPGYKNLIQLNQLTELNISVGKSDEKLRGLCTTFFNHVKGKKIKKYARIKKFMNRTERKTFQAALKTELSSPDDAEKINKIIASTPLKHLDKNDALFFMTEIISFMGDNHNGGEAYFLAMPESSLIEMVEKVYTYAIKNCPDLYKKLDGSVLEEVFKKTPNLTTLTIADKNIQDKDLSSLKQYCPQLKILNLVQTFRLQGHVEADPKLEVLSLVNGAKLDQSFLEYIGQAYPSLKELNFGEKTELNFVKGEKKEEVITKVASQDKIDIGVLPKTLEKLFITDIRGSTNNRRNQGQYFYEKTDFSRLAEFSALKEINFNPVDMSFFEDGTKNGQPERIYIEEQSYAARIVKNLPASVEKVDISRCGINNYVLQQLTQKINDGTLSNLKELKVETDPKLKFLISEKVKQAFEAACKKKGIKVTFSEKTSFYQEKDQAYRAYQQTQKAQRQLNELTTFKNLLMESEKNFPAKNASEKREFTLHLDRLDFAMRKSARGESLTKNDNSALHKVATYYDTRLQQRKAEEMRKMQENVLRFLRSHIVKNKGDFPCQTFQEKTNLLTQLQTLQNTSNKLRETGQLTSADMQALKKVKEYCDTHLKVKQPISKNNVVVQKNSFLQKTIRQQPLKRTLRQRNLKQHYNRVG